MEPTLATAVAKQLTRTLRGKVAGAVDDPAPTGTTGRLVAGLLPHLAVEARVVGRVDGPYTAVAELGADRIRAEGGTRGRRSSGDASAQAEGRVAIGYKQEGIRLNAEPPSAEAHDEVEQAPGVVAGHEDREPGDDHGEECENGGAKIDHSAAV